MLEAMGCECMIAAHDNEFNRAILENDADYFSSAQAITNILENNITEEEKQKRKENNLEKINQHFNWSRIIDQYEELFFSVKRPL